jgi:hypothetical protein
MTMNLGKRFVLFSCSPRISTVGSEIPCSDFSRKIGVLRGGGEREKSFSTREKFVVFRSVWDGRTGREVASSTCPEKF